MSQDLEDMRADCNITAGAGKMPFIAFDLAGGANLTGSEMLCGGSGNPANFLSTAGYAKLGLPGNMTPGSANAASPTNNFVNNEFGAALALGRRHPARHAGCRRRWPRAPS